MPSAATTRSFFTPRATPLALCCLLTLSGAGQAATLRWTGAGSSPLWSDPANWSPSRPPADGDDLLFAGAPPSSTSVLDGARSFGSLTFDTDARAFALHVQGDGAAMSFSGAGIRNLTAGSGPIRQSLFADAGSRGGTIAFNGGAGVNTGTSASVRPVDLTALGGSTAGTVGGHLVFRDAATAGTASFDALRAEGAGVAGASGGDIVFGGSAVAGRSASVTVTGGTAVGAAGAQASFAGLARLEGTLNVLAGSGLGDGARVGFSGGAVVAATSAVSLEGGASTAPGAAGTLSFSDDARLLGGVYNGAGRAAGASGGLLEFRGRSGHDSSDPAVGMVEIVNIGASVADARGGRTVFRDDAAIVGMQLRIENRADSEGPAAGAMGGASEFRDRAGAGSVTLVNQGAWTAGGNTAGGSTDFVNQSSAQSADITSRGGGVANAPGGALRFADDASAGHARIEAEGGLATDARGGSTRFADRSQAGGASIRNGGGTVIGAFGGSLAFVDTASAGSATIVNAPGQVSQSAGGTTTFSGGSGASTAFISNEAAFGAGVGGRTEFLGSSSAEQARIDNHGGLSLSSAATTRFGDRASADYATIANLGGQQAGGVGGYSYFTQQASAGTAHVVAAGGIAAGASGGGIAFNDDANAAGAAFDLRAATVTGASGSRTSFFDRASAGAAQFIVQGSALVGTLGREGASVTFFNGATAGSAVITLTGNGVAGGDVGRATFTGRSTAAQASFAVQAGIERGGSLGFEGTDATTLASAVDARIVNQASSTGLLHGSVAGGGTSFLSFGTAGSAVIVNEAGRGAGSTSFFLTGRAGDAIIDNAGGAGSDMDGGATRFTGSSNAERAVIVNRAGAIGTSGFDAAGRTLFTDQASAGSARITAEGGRSAAQWGGLIQFGGNATPDAATLTAQAGSGGGGSGGGGRIVFTGLTNSSAARIVLQGDAGGPGSGSFDISGLSASVSGVAVGSIEGGGVVQLGGKTLAVWGGGTSRTFSGVIRDGGAAGGTGGSLAVTGGAQLTLTGASSYSGGTHVGNGVTADSGKLIVANVNGSATGSGPVVIDRGGTLAGSGFIAGPVTLHAGGTIAPGDPVTLTLRDSLTWNAGGVIRLVLGADDAGSDHLNVGTLIHGTDGVFAIELIDTGIVAGRTYALLGFDSVIGFEDTAFAVTGASGSFAFADGRLGFTAMAVPEPGTWALFAMGMLCVAWWGRRVTVPA